MKRQNSIAVNHTNILILLRKKWCPEADLNHRHADFQSAALPTELSGHPVREPGRRDLRLAGKGVFQRRKRARYTILKGTVQHPFCGFFLMAKKPRPALAAVVEIVVLIVLDFGDWNGVGAG